MIIEWDLTRDRKGETRTTQVGDLTITSLEPRHGGGVITVHRNGNPPKIHMTRDGYTAVRTAERIAHLAAQCDCVTCEFCGGTGEGLDSVNGALVAVGECRGCDGRGKTDRYGLCELNGHY